MKKLLFGLIATVMLGFVGSAQQVGITKNFYQSTMETLVLKTKPLYNENPKIFLTNVAKNEGVALTTYETSLLLEIHANSTLSFGNYRTDVLSKNAEYLALIKSESSTAKSRYCSLIRGAILVLSLICDWAC
jgi:hypothetical protein